MIPSGSTLARPAPGAASPRPCGYSLVEVIVALVILEIGVLGAAGMVVMAAREVASAAGMERELSLAEAVADSILAGGWGGDGQRVEGAFVVEWSGAAGWAVVEARDLDGGTRVRIPVPVVQDP